MRSLLTLLAAALLALAGCGSDGDAIERDVEGTGMAMRGTTVIVGDSEFGRMLFDSRRQAIYIFEKDRRNRSRCYGECAAAWPPVYAKGEPIAGRGVHRSLLGTTRRRNGRRQVTYAGKPLYYYAHEGPREVRCHDVFLNGGRWWVIGPNGKRRP